jgi:glycosyltransferase involved in cell wall biosynthesis
VDEARRTYAGGAEAIEVIVTDNDSTDRTAEIARDRGCRVAHVERRRIACARNGGAAAASGEVLCFVDADFRIHPETFNVIDRELATGRFIGGATGLRAERLWPWGIDGGVWFCRREDFDAVGGYDESVPFSEDVRLLWALRKLGRRRRPRQKLTRGRSTGRPAKALASARKFNKHGDWHFLRDALCLMYWILLRPQKAEAHARRYWYEDER